MSTKKWLSKNIWIWSVFGSLVMWIMISIITRNFSFKVISGNATLASFLVLMSLGQMTVITSGNGAIDLSTQYTVALGAYLASILMTDFGIVIGLAVTLALCAVVGLINGIVNLYLKVPAMITTLAVGFIVYSVVLLLSSVTTGMPVSEIAYFTQKARVFGISPLIPVAIGAAAIMGLLLYHTKYGKRLHAVGQNRTAAVLSGISAVKAVMAAFIICSVLSGFAGVLLGGYFGGAQQDMGLSYLMTSVAAVVIGGTSVAGGRSSVAGVIAGSMVLTLIVAFLNLSRLAASYQNLIQGGLLMVLLIASVPKKRRV